MDGAVARGNRPAHESPASMAAQSPPPDLPAAWPHRTASRAVDAAGLRWHVQCMGAGPVLLLLHGTGAATSSWQGVLPRLAADFTVVAPDLPGHGFTSALPAGRACLPEMAHALAQLMRVLELPPRFIAGHSAGAAIAAQMALAETPQVERLAWLAGALRPLGGVAGVVGAPLARMLSRNDWLMRLAAARAGDEAAVRRLIATTGSTLDDAGRAAYAVLMRRPAHVAGALAMMAGWDLAPLQRALGRIAQPVLLLHGDIDRTVPAAQSDDAARRLRTPRVVRLPGLGHLAHEERPADVARLLRDWFTAAG